MTMEGVRNLAAEFGGINRHWSPRVIAAANGQYVKLAKVQGEFVWHSHAAEDEIFIIHRGRLTLRFRDRPDVTLGEGDLYVVPKGVEHCPVAKEECWLMLLEPAETKHTGDVETPLTRSIDEQVAAGAIAAGAPTMGTGD
ncbi:MAG TPA: cupin domain-containing protein [Longimicrobium sp.]|nr:cupin domain-containing protein [Longimicrobium sp.]